MLRLTLAETRELFTAATTEISPRPSQTKKESPTMKSKQRAFTLVEILVVVGIIVLIIGILLPVVLNAKKSAYHTQAISDLHQLGLAQSIYENDNGGLMAYGAPTLIAAGLAPSEIASVPIDKYRDGETNAWLQLEMKELPKGSQDVILPYITSYRLTFFGWRERTAPSPPKDSYDKCFVGQPNPGWLIDPTYDGTAPSSLLSDAPIMMGEYNRLLNDGSVVHRHTRYSGNCKLGSDLSCKFSWTSLFADGDEAWLNRLFDPKETCDSP